MGRLLPLSEARKNLSELVNEAYYEGKLFGISKGGESPGNFIDMTIKREDISKTANDLVAHWNTDNPLTWWSKNQKERDRFGVSRSF